MTIFPRIPNGSRKLTVSSPKANFEFDSTRFRALLLVARDCSAKAAVSRPGEIQQRQTIVDQVVFGAVERLSMSRRSAITLLAPGC